MAWLIRGDMDEKLLEKLIGRDWQAAVASEGNNYLALYDPDERHWWHS
jgi:hypothetical protein